MNFFDKLQSMGGNYVSRLGGADILKQDQLQELDPQQLAFYNQQKEAAKTAGMRELAARLSDAFAGRDIVGRASQRSQARDAQQIKNYEKTKRARQKQLDEFKQGLDLPEGLSIGGKTLLIGNRLANAGFIDESLPYFQMADKYTDKLTDKDKFTFEKDLRSEYDKQSKNVIDALNQARTAKKALEQGTGIGDIQAVFSFMKAVDPGSRVTEGEIELTAQAGGKLRTLAAFANKAATGKVFDEATRRELWTLMSEVTTDNITGLNDLQDKYTGLTSSYGVSAENVISPYSFDLNYISTPLGTDFSSDGSGGSDGTGGSAKSKKY